MSDESINFIEIWGRQKTEILSPQQTRLYWDAEYYTWAQAGDDASVRDERHVNELVESLLSKSSAWRNEQPVAAPGFAPWFTVALGVSGTRRSISHYTIDYHAHNGCPLAVRTIGMDIYKLVKANIKKAIRAGRAK